MSPQKSRIVFHSTGHSEGWRDRLLGVQRLAPWTRGAALVVMTFGLCACASGPSSHSWHWPFARQEPIFVPQSVAPSAADVLTQHNDAARTGADTEESRLTPAALEAGRFQRLFDWKVDGQIYAQPLYVSGINVGGRTISLVLVATMNNSVYAFEAPPPDSTVQPSKAPLWKVDQHTLGRPLPYNYFPMSSGFLGHNIDPKIGIVSTPVVDLARGSVYVSVKYGSCALLWFFCHAHFRLVRLGLDSGQVILSVPIVARFPENDPHGITFDAKYQLQRPALLEANGLLYMAFSSHQDTPPYHGWVLAYDASDLKLVKTYCDSCALPADTACPKGVCDGGIWQSGSGLAWDGQGAIYLMSGNGSSDRTGGDLSSAFLRLDEGLNVVGAWMPPNFACLNETDSDLGSAGPALLTQGEHTRVIGGGKEGLLYALPSNVFQGALVGHGTPGPLGSNRREVCPYQVPLPGQDRGVSTIQAAPPWDHSLFMDILKWVAHSGLGLGYHHIHGTPVIWKAHDDAHGDRWLVYVSAERDELRAYELRNGALMGAPAGSTTPASTYSSHCPNSHRGMPGGFLTLSAHGSDAQTAVLWVAMPQRDEDALRHTVQGVLRAYRAVPDTGSVLTEIWNSDDGSHPRSDADCDYIPDRSDHELGWFAKFVSPTVAEGKVYMATFSNRLVVYGLQRGALIPLNAAVTSNVKPFDATLALDSAPSATIEPGSKVSITITATNQGTQTWTSADSVYLDSQTIPDFDRAVVGGTNALTISKDVAPRESYVFRLTMRAPSEEGQYHYDWRLRHGTPERPLEWIGSRTSPWQLSAYREACADIRARAEALSRQVAEQIAARLPQVPEVDAQTALKVGRLEKDAAKRKCVVPPKMADMQGHLMP